MVTHGTAERRWWATGGISRLLFGQAISAVGSQVTFMAIPLIAVLTLGATPAGMGVLGAVDNLPYLLFGLWIGVFVDRTARRRVMVASDLMRALAVLSVPVAFVTGTLSFVHLCIVAFIVGLGNIAFDVACQAHLPELVEEEHLVSANGVLQTSAGLASVGAPGLVGLLIKLAGAPVSMVIDAVTYIVSAVSLAGIQQPEHPRPVEDSTTWQQIREGLEVVRSDPRLVGLGGAAAMVSIGMNAAFAVLVFYLANARGFDSVMIGLIFLTFGVGGAVGALTASALSTRLGVGPVLMAGPILGALGLVLVATADGRGVVGLAELFAGALLLGLGLMAQQVLAAGVRQRLAPERVRGRVLGTLRFLEWGSMPLGSLLGGTLGEWTGSLPTLVVSAAFVASSPLWVATTPLRSLQEVPTQA